MASAVLARTERVSSDGSRICRGPSPGGRAPRGYQRVVVVEVRSVRSLLPELVTLARTALAGTTVRSRSVVGAGTERGMTQTRGHKKNRPRAASTGEPPVSDGGPAAPASKSCEGYLSRLAKAEAVSTMPQCLPPQRTRPTRPPHPRHTTPLPSPLPRADGWSTPSATSGRAQRPRRVLAPKPKHKPKPSPNPSPNPSPSANPTSNPNLSPKQPRAEGGEVHGAHDDAGRNGQDARDGHNAHGEPCWLAEAWSEVGIAGREAERQERP